MGIQKSGMNSQYFVTLIVRNTQRYRSAYHNEMRWMIVILFLLPGTLQAQEYEVVKRCLGSGTHAILVEYHDQYYTVETPQFFQHNWQIRDLPGIQHGGNHLLYYSDAVSSQNNMQVNVLSRMRWRYAGKVGAQALCRMVTQAPYHNYR
ncbi:hypothetical protein NC796_11085 [Aliifodinibius sp. S!AR15-10]|uniref:hypothetical protein n=1 Tax=Aliifodinibius sp. S!AR15-10 TaxID=2950437 RepID=UPI002861C545|nr:hypothetical protein [Aliifodinibius sp. S!AR15-10]MDR8391689.1 hypothetical protein [Aliifodinibius sp. S!AR15-10]